MDQAHPAPAAEHVILIAWDGMRPDFVTDAYAPALSQLAQEGVTFRHHHAVYPSLTTVNATALATGVYPSRSGLIGNYEYRAGFDPAQPTRMDTAASALQGDKASDGKYLAVPTLSELVQAGGGRCAVVGTKTASVLHERRPVTATKSVTLFSGTTLPPTALAEIVKAIGPFPATDEIPNVAQDAWTTRALTESLWNEGVPRYSVLWMSDPDRSQHATMPGSEAALAGIRSVDTQLAVVLRALEQKGDRATTDIFVVSDHGFSTIERSIDVAGLMRKEGFAIKATGDTPPRGGEVRVVGNGGTVFFYVAEHDEPTIRRAVEWLQSSDFAGVIFSRLQIDGTFPLAQVHIDSPQAPDIAMAFRWSDARNRYGVAGSIASNGVDEANKATHGTLSPFDVHNTFIAAGPDFRRGAASNLPTSNLDVAATIAHVLRLNPPQPLDGRVVTEGMIEAHGDTAAAEPKSVEATRDLPAGKWRQYLRTSTVGSSTYFDQGNGSVEKK